MSSKLLIDSKAVMVLSELAEKVGLNEAIALQQVHYWLTTFKEADKERHYRDGRWWVYNTYQNWQKDNFPWWSAKTVERTFVSLREKGLLIATSDYNQKSYDRTLWYTIDYDALDTLTTKWGEGYEGPSRQNGEMEDDKMSSPIPESNTESNNRDSAPVGADYVGDPVLVEHDLEEEAYYLEGTGAKKDEITAMCPECGETNRQDENMCPGCGAFVVWHKSRVWKRLYGKPEDAVREFEGVDLKAASPLETEFCTKFNRKPEFANLSQQREFRRLARAYPAGFLRELMEWATGGGFKGFTAFRNAADNPANLEKYRSEHGISVQEDPEPEEYQPSGWEILAMEMAGDDDE